MTRAMSQLAENVSGRGERDPDSSGRFGSGRRERTGVFDAVEHDAANKEYRRPWSNDRLPIWD